MDVHSGTSLWQAMEGRGAVRPPLREDARCEVAIVGAGVTGALVARYLLREGVDTILLEKHDGGSASTAASTGLLQYEADTPLSELIAKVGETSAVQSYRLGLSAIDEIERLTAELPDECGFSRRPSLYIASNESHLARLQTEYECRAANGFDVQFLTAAQLADASSLRAPGAIRSSGDAQINPLRFTRELLRRCEAEGLRMYGGCEVQAIIPESDGVLLVTDQGRVRARRVVVATGYAAQTLLKEKVATLHSTYAAASLPLASFDGWPEQCLMWETARPYFYLRSSQDGRAIIGGEDTDYSTDHQRDGLVAEKVRRLQQQFQAMFPQIPFECAFAWAGTFAETKDGLAYIGESPELPHAYFAMGYGGNGITFGAIAARIIADLFVRRPNADASIFGFGRQAS